MSAWLIENSATIVIAVILFVLVLLAASNIWKNKGKCHSSGCENCSRYNGCKKQAEKKD